MQSRMTQYSVFSLLLSASVGCVSRASTECEMDKRSGLYPSSFCESSSNTTVQPTEGKAVSNLKPSAVPVRSEPLVKRVWVNDQILEGGHWMQGTWLYIEVEPSKWVGSTLRQPAIKLGQSGKIQTEQPEKLKSGGKQ